MISEIKKKFCGRTLILPKMPFFFYSEGGYRNFILIIITATIGVHNIESYSLIIAQYCLAGSAATV